MDHTSRSTDEIIELMKSSLSDCDETRRLLNTLLHISLENEEDSFFPEATSLLFGSAIQVLPQDEVYLTILEPFLPMTKNFLFKTLNKNLTLIGDSSHIPDVLSNLEAYLQMMESPLTKKQSLFQSSVIEKVACGHEISLVCVTSCISFVCSHVLSDIENLLAYLISLNQIVASEFYTVPKTLAEVVLMIFTHCQKSELEYRDVFSVARSSLMALFQQSHKVQVKLFTLLNEKLIFNCALEEDVQQLVDIITVLQDMSEVVAELDTMSLVAHWKGFAHLTQTYSTHLCSRLDIARPITYLAVNITHQLGNLTNYVNAEKKVMMRALKITSLQLKVLIKLCEEYKDHLGDCHQPLLNCLISLTARTSGSLSREGLTGEVAAQVLTHLCAGAAPLLSHLLGDAQFVQSYLQYTDKLQCCPVSDQFGYCNLTSLILKKFTQGNILDEETKQLWLGETLPLIETTFKILENCEKVFFTYEEDSYRSLLTRTAATIVATTSTAAFIRLEQLIICRLLQPALWPAVFVSDLLCLITRVGSSKLCLQLATLLRDLCSMWPVWDRSRPEWCYVNWTLARITRFLAADDLRAFPNHLPSVTTVVSDLSALLNKPFSGESLQLYESLMGRLTFLKHHVELFPHAKAALAPPVCQMWLRMTLPADLDCMECSDWFSTLFSTLIVITSRIVDHLDNVQIKNILDVLENVSCSSTVLKCGACTFLRSLAKKSFPVDPTRTIIFNKVASLFVKLMLDKHPLIKQFSFETFSYFAYVTNHEEIVANIVARDCVLQNEITDYLKGVPIMKSNSDFSEYYENLRAPFVHKCRTNKSKVFEELDVDENPCKKFKTSLVEESVTGILQKIENDLSSIREFQNCSEETRKLVLKCVGNRIDEVMRRF